MHIDVIIVAWKLIIVHVIGVILQLINLKYCVLTGDAPLW